MGKLRLQREVHGQGCTTRTGRTKERIPCSSETLGQDQRGETERDITERWELVLLGIASRIGPADIPPPQAQASLRDQVGTIFLIGLNLLIFENTAQEL